MFPVKRCNRCHKRITTDNVCKNEACNDFGHKLQLIGHKMCFNHNEPFKLRYYLGVYDNDEQYAGYGTDHSGYYQDYTEKIKLRRYK